MNQEEKSIVKYVGMLFPCYYLYLFLLFPSFEGYSAFVQIMLSLGCDVVAYFSSYFLTIFLKSKNIAQTTFAFSLVPVVGSLFSLYIGLDSDYCLFLTAMCFVFEIIAIAVMLLKNGLKKNN